MPLVSGTRLGPYEIGAPLGAGGMGEVYRAKDTRLGRDVAIKILPQHLSSDPELRERFDREARAISSLNHPRICILHDVGHQDRIDFLVMEYLEGQSLAERLQRGPLQLKQTLQVGMEVCEALDVAHRAGIVHRDLKPANIMLTRDGVKLMDFGLAKAALGGHGVGNSTAPLLSAAKTVSGPSPISPLTTAGQMMGTIQYMSPEQIEGKDADARSDIFALGAVLYEMATGKRPFDGKSQLSVANAILEKDPEPISVIQPLTPPGFERVVITCLEKNPDDRFQSARDVRLALKWIAEGRSDYVVQSETAAPKSVTRNLPWAIAAILALVLIVGGVIFFPGNNKLDPQYTTVTYREGELGAARFSHDGQTVVYSGEWEKEPRQISTYRVGNPESRNLGIPSATVADLSSTDQLAILRDCEHVFLLECGGTLATVSLAGGSPRDLAGHIAYADWSPDGLQLVVSKVSADGASLEFPPGHVLYQQKAGWLAHPKFSPDGTVVAFENHPNTAFDDGSVDTIDLSGKRTVLSKGWLSIEGLAWSPNGKEIWFASNSARTGWADSIRAVTLSGKERTLLVMPSIRLHDISSDGRVLMSRENWRSQLLGFFPGDKEDHPYSWLDDTTPTGISSDGRTLSFAEEGEVWSLAGESQGYFRSTDGSAPVSLGAGLPIVAPDGTRVLVAIRSSHKLLVQPVGPGEAKELPTPGLVAFDHLAWSDDGRFIAYEAQTLQNGWNVYRQPIAGGSPELVLAGTRNSFPKLSPDGQMLALRREHGGISLHRLNGSQPVALQGVEDSEFPIRFADDGKSLLVGQANGRVMTLTLVDVASGRREPWKQLKSDARDGSQIVVTPDLKYYAYETPRYSSVLYIVANLH
jgi:eukaryotic-like serine/threonine-protein kinase